jgi:hypothetical protein
MAALTLAQLFKQASAGQRKSQRLGAKYGHATAAGLKRIQQRNALAISQGYVKAPHGYVAPTDALIASLTAKPWNKMTSAERLHYRGAVHELLPFALMNDAQKSFFRSKGALAPPRSAASGDDLGVAGSSAWGGGSAGGKEPPTSNPQAAWFKAHGGPGYASNQPGMKFDLSTGTFGPKPAGSGPGSSGSVPQARSHGGPFVASGGTAQGKTSSDSGFHAALRMAAMRPAGSHEIGRPPLPSAGLQRGEGASLLQAVISHPTAPPIPVTHPTRPNRAPEHAHERVIAARKRMVGYLTSGV